MAHFIGTVQGSRGEASRLGGKEAGMNTYAASYQGGVDVQLYDQDGVDYARIRLKPHQGRGRDVEVYNGPISGDGLPPGPLKLMQTVWEDKA